MAYPVAVSVAGKTWQNDQIHILRKHYLGVGRRLGNPVCSRHQVIKASDHPCLHGINGTGPVTLFIQIDAERQADPLALLEQFAD